METAGIIESIVKEKFPVGSRVKSDCFSDRKLKKRAGTVRGYAKGGFAQFGFNCLCCLQIIWDGRKTPDTHFYRYCRLAGDTHGGKN